MAQCAAPPIGLQKDSHILVLVSPTMPELHVGSAPPAVVTSAVVPDALPPLTPPEGLALELWWAVMAGRLPPLCAEAVHMSQALHLHICARRGMAGADGPHWT